MGKLQLKRSSRENREGLPKGYHYLFSRTLCEKDFGQIRRGFKKLFREIKEDKFFHPFPFTKATIEKILNAKQDLYYLLFDKKKAVGFFMLRGWDEGYNIPSFGMVVHPNYRSIGLGKIMLQSAIELCRFLVCKKIRLTVDEGNTIAKRMYQKTGFKFKGNVGFKTL